MPGAPEPTLIYNRGRMLEIQDGLQIEADPGDEQIIPDFFPEVEQQEPDDQLVPGQLILEGQHESHDQQVPEFQQELEGYQEPDDDQQVPEG